VILVPETTRLSISSGSLGNSIRNGLKIDTVTIAAIDRITAAGTAMRSAIFPARCAPARGTAGACGVTVPPPEQAAIDNPRELARRGRR